MKNEDCVFCKIVEGTLPSSKIYEDEHIIAFLDITPINPGHTLVIPKSHHENIFEIPDETLAHMSPKIKALAKAIKHATGAHGVNITQNNGKAAGQVVFHSHTHIMPRFDDDGYGLWKHKRPYNEGEKETVAEEIKKALGIQ